MMTAAIAAGMATTDDRARSVRSLPRRHSLRRWLSSAVVITAASAGTVLTTEWAWSSPPPSTAIASPQNLAGSLAADTAALRQATKSLAYVTKALNAVSASASTAPPAAPTAVPPPVVHAISGASGAR